MRRREHCHFLAAPDFELPTDSDGNNIYEVTVEVSDDLGATDTQQIQVTVTNVAEQHVIVVDTTSDYDTGDARYGDTTSLSTLLADRGTDGLISLREAIEAANNTTNDGFLDEIHFNIATPLVNGAHTIQVIGPLPEITDPVVIDGTTEPGLRGHADHRAGRSVGHGWGKRPGDQRRRQHDPRSRDQSVCGSWHLSARPGRQHDRTQLHRYRRDGDGRAGQCEGRNSDR